MAFWAICTLCSIGSNSFSSLNFIPMAAKLAQPVNCFVVGVVDSFMMILLLQRSDSTRGMAHLCSFGKLLSCGILPLVWAKFRYLAPTSREDLWRDERAWHVDINDGVRVNIAPLQLAGVLASDVLHKPADAKKALADRARWRADERRWVRDGKLPRCGWMDESVPESPRWTEREPERVAEQIKLEQKRQALQSRRAEEVEV